MLTRMPFNFEYMRQRREQIGKTQQQCADEAGFKHLQRWSKYENGRISNPELETMETIARVLRCGVAKLIRE